MISKELLGEILNDSKIHAIKIEDKKVKATIHTESLHIKNRYRTYYINIYELAHKCKDWALKQGCILNSCEYMKDASCEVKHPFCEDRVFGEYRDLEAGTEPEAIFKACEWIKEQLDAIQK